MSSEFKELISVEVVPAPNQFVSGRSETNGFQVSETLLLVEFDCLHVVVMDLEAIDALSLSSLLEVQKLLQ